MGVSVPPQTGWIAPTGQTRKLPRTWIRTRKRTGSGSRKSRWNRRWTGSGFPKRHLQRPGSESRKRRWTRERHCPLDAGVGRLRWHCHWWTCLVIYVFTSVVTSLESVTSYESDPINEEV